MKFGRTYRMVVNGQQQQWIISMPFTCKFKTSDTGTPTANTAHFYLYNLPEKLRNDILKDVFESPEYRQISFAAGYESEPTLPLVFVGNVFWAYSYRQGPDWITEIDALDGGWAIETGVINYTASTGTRYSQILRTICQALPNIKVGIISNALGGLTSGRGVSVSGNPWDELIRRVLPLDAQVFISRETVYVMGQNEYLANNPGITEISEDTGIIGSPRRQNIMTVATMVFEPRMEVGQKITLKSLQPYSGDHKVMMIEHQGTISPAVSEDLVTRATFFRAPNLAQAVDASLGVAA